MPIRSLYRFVCCAMLAAAANAGAQTITVSAAISLREAMRELGPMFT